MYAEMLYMSREWGDMVLFYNGAKCGASAPDHAHLQACGRNCIPLFGEYWQEEISCGMEPLLVDGEGCLYNVTTYAVPLFVISARSVSRSLALFRTLVAALPSVDDEAEPRMNIFVYHTAEDGYVTVVIPRSAHRPAAYYATGEGMRLVSPGAIDMAGLVVTPRKDDFMVITADEAMAMLQEVALSRGDVEDVVEQLVQMSNEEC